MVDNLPRILPKACDAVIAAKSWKKPPIFQLLERAGDIQPSEMYQVFNMGIGMAVVLSRKDAPAFLASIRAKEIGCIESGTGIVRLELGAEA